MGRILIILGSLLLPLAVYLLWLALARRKQALAAAGQLPWWQALPWTWLIVAGVILMGTTLVTLRLLDLDIDELLFGGPEASLPATAIPPAAIPAAPTPSMSSPATP